MTTSELVFIPSPGAGHLPPTVELANLLLHRDHRLSITIIIINTPNESDHKTVNTTDRLRFVNIPSDDSAKDIPPAALLTGLLEHHKPRVRNIVRDITESDSVRLVGFVLDMFCVVMAEVAHEFAAPTYIYFTSSASALGLMFYLQTKHDQEGFELTGLKDSDSELSFPSYANPVPVKLLPPRMFHKESGFDPFMNLARKYRVLNGIIVNTFQELEKHAIEFLFRNDTDIPPVFPVGPILNLKNTTNDSKTDEIMRWLDDQPESSVVFLCFGSMGSFKEEQLKEMAIALENSGQRFLWSVRRPPSKDETMFPTEYENPEEALPEGFIERTSGMGKVIGWAPQTAVLSHPSVGGFVSHCGWNSTLESIWFGVPVAAWPMYAEQQLNAFKVVVELGIATEIKIDYQSSYHRWPGSDEKEMIVTAKEIEGGIRRLMGDGEMRKKMMEMKDKSRLAVSEGGSSYASIGRLIYHVLIDYIIT